MFMFLGIRVFACYTTYSTHTHINPSECTVYVHTAVGDCSPIHSPLFYFCRRSGGGGVGCVGGGHGGSDSSTGGVGCTGGLASSLAGVAGLGMSAKHARHGYTILPTSAPGKMRLFMVIMLIMFIILVFNR